MRGVRRKEGKEGGKGRKTIWITRLKALYYHEKEHTNLFYGHRSRKHLIQPQRILKDVLEGNTWLLSFKDHLERGFKRHQGGTAVFVEGMASEGKKSWTEKGASNETTKQTGMRWEKPSQFLILEETWNLTSSGRESVSRILSGERIRSGFCLRWSFSWVCREHCNENEEITKETVADFRNIYTMFVNK